MEHYYIPINDTIFELSGINKFSDSISLFFKTRLTLVTCCWGAVCKVNFKHGTRDGKHESRNKMQLKLNQNNDRKKVFYSNLIWCTISHLLDEVNLIP